MCKLRQDLRYCVIQPSIYDYETIEGITWIIIGDGRQYFKQYFMPSEFTVNIIEGKIAFSTSTLGLLVNQLSICMPIRVSGIP